MGIWNHLLAPNHPPVLSQGTAEDHVAQQPPVLGTAQVLPAVAGAEEPHVDQVQSSIPWWVAWEMPKTTFEHHAWNSQKKLQ